MTYNSSMRTLGVDPNSLNALLAETAGPENHAVDPTLFENILQNRLSAASRASAPQRVDPSFAKQWAQQILATTRGMLMTAFGTTSQTSASPLEGMLGLLSLMARMREFKTVAEPAQERFRPGSKYDAVVGHAARRYNLPEKLIHAVIKAESNYNPDALSPVGAQGLMQLMPQTARDLGVSDARDPFQNVMGGSKYLREMLDRYDGNLRSALAAYNWGPANVDEKGTTRLPAETTAYIRRIAELLKNGPSS